MSPYERIWRSYQERRPEVDFGKLVGWYLQHGFVFNTPDFFAMGRRANRLRLGSKVICDRTFAEQMGDDTWLIEAFAGDMPKLWRVFSILEPLPWVAFTRLNDPTQALTFVELSRLHRLCPPDLSSVDALQQESLLAQT